MSKNSKCFLKINKTPSNIIKEEPKEQEEELCFDDCVIEEEPQYDEPEQDFEEQKDEEYIKQQKKIGLMCHCGLTTILREVKKDGPVQSIKYYLI